jgi:hypothetical protein
LRTPIAGMSFVRLDPCISCGMPACKTALCITMTALRRAIDEFQLHSSLR